jgi:hypothetical protein
MSRNANRDFGNGLVQPGLGNKAVHLLNPCSSVVKVSPRLSVGSECL